MKNRKLKNAILLILFTVALIFVCVQIKVVWEIVVKILGVLSPIFVGFFIAYVLNMPYKFFYFKAFKKMGTKRPIFLKVKKPLAIVVTYVLVLGLITGFFIFFIPKIIESAQSLFKDIPTFANNVSNYLKDVIYWLDEKFGLQLENSDNFTQLIESITGTKLSNLLSVVLGWVFPQALATVTSTAFGLYNTILGIIISIYMLVSKEQLLRGFNKLIKAIFPDKAYNYTLKVIRVSDQKCGKFIVGKTIELVIMGALYFLVFGIIGFHYWALISIIMTVTGLIPFFGPFIGGIPSALILLIINPIDCLWFIIALLVLQQIDGNVIGPKVLGDSVGLPGIWILVSVVIFGGLFGVLGMLFGVPVFAVIYTLIKDGVEFRLKKKIYMENKDK